MTNIATIGHNQPPEPTPFEAIETRINDLYDEAKIWLDGEPVTTTKQAAALNTLENLIRAAAKDAEALRKTEVAPLDDAKAEIQARYNALIGETKTVTGKTVTAINAVKAALKPYLLEVERRQREDAARAKAEADALAKAAQDAIAARDKANLQSIEAAEQLITDAAQARKDADRIAAAKPLAKGEGRATGLRTVYKVEIASYRDAAAWAYKEKSRELADFLVEVAQAEVRTGKREISGFNIIEERTV